MSAPDAPTIAVAGEADLADLLPLMRALLRLLRGRADRRGAARARRSLIADPEREGVQLIARDAATARAVGFATVFWTWSTTRRAARIAS